MKAQLVPLYFDPGRDAGFDEQVAALKNILADKADILAPVPLGGRIPGNADAVVFPQLLGEAYRRAEDFKKIDKPILVVTSQFGTLSMWDWELIAYLRTHGVDTIAPYNLDQAKKVCNALKVKRELRETKFLVYQDNPGEGAQPGIFKRFYWWEDECTQRMKDLFGVTIIKRSFRDLGARAKQVSDADADAAMAKKPSAMEGLTDRAKRSAYKLYLAVKRDLEADGAMRAAGINCLNESHFCDTTPCLAWNLLYEEQKLIWGCEADTVSMLTKHILHHSLECPIMMTNLYPFLLGDAALKHERIKAFPNVKDDPANYVLVAHCGFMGVIPRPFATDWKIRRKVLAIVDENAHAIDANLPVGDVTMAKLQPSFRDLTVVPGELTGYAQYPGSDCLNGGVIRVKDGHKFMNSLCSHHALLMTGRQGPDLHHVAKVFNVNISEV